MVGQYRVISKKGDQLPDAPTTRHYIRANWGATFATVAGWSQFHGIAWLRLQIRKLSVERPPFIPLSVPLHGRHGIVVKSG